MSRPNSVRARGLVRPPSVTLSGLPVRFRASPRPDHVRARRSPLAAALHFANHSELFGEGLQWSGCVLMTLLGQRHRFNTFDFSYHMINVARTDPRGPPVIGGIVRLARTARRGQAVAGR